MRQLSMQWRIALLTAILIASSCLVLNLLVFHSGAYYFGTLDKHVLKYDSGNPPIEQSPQTDDDVVTFDMSPEEFDAFYGEFTEELANAEKGFRQMSWIITILFSAFCGAIAFFVSGYFLRPIREFSEQADRIKMERLTEISLDENTVPEFRDLSHSINQMLHRLNAAFDAQRQFTGNAAHELKTPLALMRAKLDTYRREHLEDDSEEAETINLLSEQVDRLSSLVKTLLVMSELEELPREDHVHLPSLIEEVLTDLASLADDASIVLSREGDDVSVIGSDILLYRLVFNLVENGIKYNHPGGFVVASVTTNNSSVTIRIRDTGSGIPEKHHKSVFHPFFRVDKTRSGRMSGVGLGLPMVWEITRLHGGLVRVESSSEDGTVFNVTLPTHLQV